MFDFNATKVFDLAIKRGATDILYQSGQKPVLRVGGDLFQVEDSEVFSLSESSPEFLQYFSDEQRALFAKQDSLDFAFTHENDYRFRGNLYRQQNGLSLSLRLIRNKVLSFDQLNLPQVFRDIATKYRQGFFLIVGPTGQGKSTSMAAILNHINENRQEHIITIEDPIEYLFTNKQSVIDQRQVGTHAVNFKEAIRSAMRQDPDVLMIGEMRDYETMEAAITMAETGHLVFATLHTNDAAQTIDRIIDAFPEEKQKQVRLQLASSLTGIISQRLVPGVKGGLVFAYEQMLVTDAVRNVIRTEKTEQIYNAVQGSSESGVVRLEQCLATLVRSGDITQETALTYATNRELIRVFMEYNQ